MGHGPPNGSHHQRPRATGTGPLPAAMDTAIPDSELGPGQLSRRAMLRRAGLLGAGIAGVDAFGGAVPASAAVAGSPTRTRQGDSGLRWLAGDHHIHTRYSSDGHYRVVDQVRNGTRHGLDWMVITDHADVQHARVGVAKVNPDIRAARERYRDALVFQGLEWNIPGAEHATVFVHPGAHEVDVLRRFEIGYDGAVNDARDSTRRNEALAIAGLDFLAGQVRRARVPDALMFANHPARRGIDSPHEIRGWRDTQPRIAIGMEGAPGHQAAGIPAPYGPGSGRGYYTTGPGDDSFPGYPAESYRTWGGFDWMTATVGGLWDSLLTEGKPWWITANSDAHRVHGDVVVRPEDSDHDRDDRDGDPGYPGQPRLDWGDFWPGQYSRTHVGARDFSYAAVMDGLRAGRIWVDHGGLLSAFDARLWAGDRSATLGGTLRVERGTGVTLGMDITPALTPNAAQFVPVLARVDVIGGEVTGEATDRDAFRAPRTRVVASFEVDRSTGPLRLTHRLGRVDRPLYVRMRGTDGHRGQPGMYGARVDPAGPAMDVAGDADPWLDLWFYSDPIWVLPF